MGCRKVSVYDSGGGLLFSFVFVTVCLNAPDIQECSLQPGPILCAFEIGKYKNTNKVLMHAQSMKYNKFNFTFFSSREHCLELCKF